MCRFCKEYDDPENLFIYWNVTGTTAQHRKCRNDYEKAKRVKAGKTPRPNWKKRPKEVNFTIN